MIGEKKVESQKPLVSVVVITYNQEKYIQQAIESILMQEVDFPIEILIGDDCSEDETPRIIKQYEKEYPGIIKAFCREENVGATRNSYELYIRAQGKYIANLEGDDYWTDKFKLKKQVNFLECHPQYMCSCSDFTYVYLDGEPFDDTLSAKMKSDSFCQKEIFTLEDWNSSHLASHPGTWVFRNIFRTIKDTSILWKAHRIVGDTTIGLLIASQGETYKFPESMSCYRRAKDKGSSWTSSTAKNPFYLYELFMYHSRLEEYGKLVLKVKASLSKSKSYEFFHFVEQFLRNPGQAQWRCIWKMFRHALNKRKCLYMIMQAFFLYTVPAIVRNMNDLNKNNPLYANINRTWSDFYKMVVGRDLILYGAGGGCYDLINQYYDKLTINLIVDASEKKQGNYVMGYKVRSPECLKNFNPQKVVILITSGMYYTEIANRLEKSGYLCYFVYPVMECKKIRYWPLRFFKNDMEYLRD